MSTLHCPDEPAPRIPVLRWSGLLSSAMPALIAGAMLAAAGWAVWRSLGRMMALDELYTATLIQAPSLAHMVDGAMRGVDGNPPLYLPLAWLLTHALPFSPERSLGAFNLLALAATAGMLFRIGRRFADPFSVVVALCLLCALDGTVVYALLEIRTYALYLCLVTATLWATLAVVDRPSARRTAALASIGAGATLSHSFAGFYVVATIGAAILVSLLVGDRRRATVLGLAVLPAAVATLGWISLSFATQVAVATPYGWIPRPSPSQLAEAVTGSGRLTRLLLIGLAVLAARGRVMPWLAAWRDTIARRDRAIPICVVVAYVALTCAGWVGSQVITPFFVGRYFIPNLAAAALVIILAVAAIRRIAPARVVLAAGALSVLAGLGAVATATSGTVKLTPCLADNGSFLEDGVDGDLPLVIESPHAWLPRDRYAPGRRALYPLDWDVVLNHPHRARNNAMDYHIMEILKDWAPTGSALASNLQTTDAILARYPRFLLLDEHDRAWFSELRAARPLSATLVRQSPDCRLWDVETAPQP